MNQHHTARQTAMDSTAALRELPSARTLLCLWASAMMIMTATAAMASAPSERVAGTPHPAQELDR